MDKALSGVILLLALVFIGLGLRSGADPAEKFSGFLNEIFGSSLWQADSIDYDSSANRLVVSKLTMTRGLGLAGPLKIDKLEITDPDLKENSASVVTVYGLEHDLPFADGSAALSAAFMEMQNFRLVGSGSNKTLSADEAAFRNLTLLLPQNLAQTETPSSPDETS
ncbi:MAG: hypothetical protein LBJ64_09825, partial [Deltaproteobacteria bacterium]|nr:hypothetical protein [Deltaproteobacteria bacterium]